MRWVVFACGVVAGACRPVAMSAEPGEERDARALSATDAGPIAPLPGDAADAAPLHADAPVSTDWCIEGMRALDEDVCYVLPPLAEGKPRRLLVYLHGIVPPVAVSVQKQTVQEAVLRAATRAGAAAIVPRGRRGIGPPGSRDWWAWPTSPAAHAQLAGTLVARWKVAKTKLESIAGAPFARTYLAGSSNGAYFLTALALRGDAQEHGFPVDGYGAMSGGSPGGRGADALAGRPPRALYVGFGTYDEGSKLGALALAKVATAAHWSVTVREHPFGHGAREVYLDEAFETWDRAMVEAGRD